MDMEEIGDEEGAAVQDNLFFLFLPNCILCSSVCAAFFTK